MDPYRAIVSGGYDYGSFSLFVPAGSRLVQPTIYMAGDISFLGWEKAMESHKANYVVAKVLDEASFFAIKSTLAERKAINPYGPACYLVAVGEAARDASLLAARQPKEFAGVALLGQAASSEELSEIGKLPAPEEDHTLDNVALPLWANGQASSAISYWKRVNGCSDPVDGCYKTIRRPTEDRDLGADMVQSDNEDLCAILAFLFQKRRFPGMRDGNLRNADLPENVGALYQEAVIDGFRRYWYTYVPTHKEGEKLPLVLVMHGRGGEGGEFVARSGWRAISDEAGCITVYPTGASGVDRPITYWNFYDHGKTPLLADDLSFLSQLVDSLCEKLPVDRTRIYLSGQSMGSMMSLAMALTYPERFAASASSAGLLPGFMENLKRIELHATCPLRVSLGEFDTFIKTNDPEGNEASRWFLEELRNMEGCEPAVVASRGMDLDYVCHDQNGKERIWYTRVKGKVHAILPSEVRLFWSWMRQFRKES